MIRPCKHSRIREPTDLFRVQLPIVVRTSYILCNSVNFCKTTGLHRDGLIGEKSRCACSHHTNCPYASTKH